MTWEEINKEICKEKNMAETFQCKAVDMMLLDYFAVHGPEPSIEDVRVQKAYDLSKAHHNDRYIVRSDRQIICELRYQWAREMMKVRP